MYGEMRQNYSGCVVQKVPVTAAVGMDRKLTEGFVLLITACEHLLVF